MKKTPKKISLDFSRLSGDHVRTIAESTVGDLEFKDPAENEPAAPPPAPEPEEKKPFEGMYYPLGR